MATSGGSLLVDKSALGLRGRLVRGVLGAVDRGGGGDVDGVDDPLLVVVVA